MLDNSVTIKAPSVEQAVKIGLSKLKMKVRRVSSALVNKMPLLKLVPKLKSRSTT